MNLGPLEPQFLHHAVGLSSVRQVVVISAMIYFGVVSLPLLSCPSEEVEGSQGGGHRQMVCRIGLYVDIHPVVGGDVCVPSELPVSGGEQVPGEGASQRMWASAGEMGQHLDVQQCSFFPPLNALAPARWGPLFSKAAGSLPGNYFWTY